MLVTCRQRTSREYIYICTYIEDKGFISHGESRDISCVDMSYSLLTAVVVREISGKWCIRLLTDTDTFFTSLSTH